MQGGVVSGENYFDVVGLHPALGRLIGPQDDGPNAAGVVVLTDRFWNTALKKDPSAIGKISSPRKRFRGADGELRCPRTVGTLSAGHRNHREHRSTSSATSATMVTGRVHRMTELFGRLAPGATLSRHVPSCVPCTPPLKRTTRTPTRIKATTQLTPNCSATLDLRRAHASLLRPLTAACLVFVIACSNAANPLVSAPFAVRAS